MDIPDAYRGREQAYFKHCLLEAYLERLFMIVGHHQKTISYVDCFAGPWQEKGTELEDTSIAKSLNIITKCQKGLAGKKLYPKFRTLYIEKEAEPFRKLNDYLTSRKWEGIDTQAKHGSFYDLREDILSWCEPDSFVFFFIDPTGWKRKVDIPTLEPLLRRPNSEFLITFMYGFLSRTVPQLKFQEDMRNIFGIVSDTHRMSPAQKESYHLSLYRNNLKQIFPVGGSQPRTAFVQVQKPTKDRTLYHLVYLTRHPKGIVEFMEASEELELVQKKVRALAKQNKRVQRNGQSELFPADAFVNENEGEHDLSMVKKYWLKNLPLGKKHFGIIELSDMLEETGWFPKDFQNALRELIKEGKVRNLNAKRVRSANAINFEKGETLERLQP
jgi:three-Cys-motif partner protein